jgi:hypothetical protein
VPRLSFGDELAIAVALVLVLLAVLVGELLRAAGIL